MQVAEANGVGRANFAVPPVYVVSLADATDRRRFMSAQLDSGLVPTWRFIDAVPKANLTPAWLAEAQAVRPCVRANMSPGEHACLESHKKALRAIVENGDAFAVVLEDDVALAKSFPDRLRELVTSPAASEFDVALLHWAGLYRRLGGVRIGRRTRLHRVYSSSGGHGYMVTLAGARRMLAVFEKISNLNDDWTYMVRRAGFDVRCVVPYCVAESIIGRNSQIDHYVMPRRRGLMARLRKWLTYNLPERALRRTLQLIARQPQSF